MSMPKIVALSLFSCALALPAASQAADGEVKWGASDQPAVRAQASGTSPNRYYDAENVEKDGDLIRLKLYGSADAADKRVVDEVTINCETHEMARLKAAAGEGKREWDAPAKLFSGEALYATARDLCGWGPGFWKRLAD